MTDTKTILTALEASVGKELFEKIRSSKLLVVGAGGIGCELLKNLAMAGFTCLEAIDLDTIDVSNLNRQLLFRSHHVGAPKCTTACAVAAQMALPETVSYRAKHGNVCDNDTCNVQFVQQFDVVLNALDNVAARRRVNRLCLAAGVPLLEAGTTGFLGQVQTIHAGSNTACYECATQETAKVYPICTIRSTPSAPVHTIVWAKELYKLLFATKVEESMLYEDPAGEEPSTYMAAVMEFRDLMMSRLEEQCVVSSVVDAVKTAAKKLVTTLYVDEIQKQLDLDRYKTAKKKPVTLDAAMIDAGMEQQAAPSSKSSYKHTDVWSREECVAEWVACLQDAANGAAAGESKVLPAFDKDDDLSMRFVTATSNLRSYLFGIEPIQSYYSAKGIAGNVLPFL
jgi:ubiquitin-like 1-activating enzyme E1 B